MLILCLLLILIPLGVNFDLLDFTAKHSLIIHKTCLQVVHSSHEYTYILEAILCGKSFHGQQSYQSLQQLGLIHLFVVSGLHLSIIEGLVLRQKPSGFRLGFYMFLCFCYSLACNWKPPVVRALSFGLMRQFNRRLQLFWSTQSCQLIANLMLLFLFPQWWARLSLALSWGCSLIFSLKLNLFYKLCLVFLLLTGLFQPWIQLSPLTILSSLLLSPIILFVGFPLLIVGRLGIFTQASENFWDFCFYIFLQLKIYTQNPVTFKADWSIEVVIVVIFVVHISIVQLEVWLWRKRLQ